MSQATPLKGPTSSSAHFRPGISFDTKLSHPDPGPHHIPGSTPPTSQWITYPGNALAPFSLNFGVSMEPETSEFPKYLVLGRDENIHIRLTGSTSLGDVGCHIPTQNPPHLGLNFIWVTYPGNALAPFSLNFGVPMEPEASEFPKGLVLGRDENINIRLTGSTPLGDVACHNLSLDKLLWVCYPHTPFYLSHTP
ncbi:unnamed protein product [Malus baccata var. baccata]